ncbi:MAG: phosphatase PAP2 family protein [Saprospiraceae bacterium]|nr:phosphatase PAP2 family protein [Saprospiraceae bacterium]MBP7699106.1 phosphatase PAP2 family protein [Saprospiraceae bacterium]
MYRLPACWHKDYQSINITPRHNFTLKNATLFLLSFFTLYNSGVALTQTNNPFHLTTTKEVCLLGSGVLLMGSTYWYGQAKLNPISESTYFSTYEKRYNNIPAFERFITKYRDKGAATLSDLALGGSVLLPAAFLIDKKSRSQWLPIGIMYAEAISITIGITQWTKNISLRPRPYYFNNEIPLTERLGVEARQSFFSGHTATAAVACFFSAALFQQLYPDSNYKPYVWAGAATLPLAAVLGRIYSGNHFITDVAVAYTVGALVGVGVLELHRPKNRLTLLPIINEKSIGLYAAWSLR